MIDRILTTLFYVPTVPDWRPGEATPLAGFSRQLCETSPYLRALTQLPTTILDFVPQYHAGFFARRLCGTAPLEVHPHSPRAIRSMPVPDETPFTILILSPEERVADYAGWASSCPVRPILVSSDGEDLAYSDLSVEGLQTRLLKLCDEAVGVIAPEVLEEARTTLDAWRALEIEGLNYEVAGHGSVAPNLAALHVAGRQPIFAGPFKAIGEGRGPYVAQIVATASSLLEAREAQPVSLPEPSFPRRPGLTLFAPAMFARLTGLGPAPDAPTDITRGFQTALNLIRRQDGYSFSAQTPAQFRALFGASPEDVEAGARPSPHPLMLVRQREVSLAVTMAELLSASEASTSLRFPNEINRTAGAVRQFANHYRAADRRRSRTLAGFRAVQARLAEATPPEFLDLIRKAGPEVRIVADAHLEWLDVDGLPLCIRKTVFTGANKQLAAALTALSGRIHGEICPVCGRDFAEVSDVPLAAHISEEVQNLIETAGRVEALVRDRTNTASAVTLGQRRQAELQARVLPDERRDVLKTDVAQFSEWRTDDVHIAQFAALLRSLKREGRQVILAVHDRQLFEYLALELSPTVNEDRLITVELGRSADGMTTASWKPTVYELDKAVA